MNELQLDILVLSENYLPAVRSEGPDEKRFGKLAISAAQRCGLANVRDLLISLSGGHAILTAIPVAPLLFAPPHQPYTLIDLAGIYHEFGHVVFASNPHIADRLTRVVDAFFVALEQAAGYLTPSQRAERIKDIWRAAQYWALDRVNELFSDIFATYTLGPAHYYSCVDLGIRFSDEPHEIELTDVHPPFGARVAACRFALVPGLQNDPISVAATALWQEYCGSSPTSGEYRLFCPDSLLQEIVKEAIDALINGQYSQYKPSGQNSSTAANVNLEQMLNQATLRLIQDATGYSAWESTFIQRIYA